MDAVLIPRSLADAQALTLEALIWSEVHAMIFGDGGRHDMAQIGKGIETVTVAAPSLPQPVSLPNRKDVGADPMKVPDFREPEKVGV